MYVTRIPGLAAACPDADGAGGIWQILFQEAAGKEKLPAFFFFLSTLNTKDGDIFPRPQGQN